jgi:IS30 family transposase
MISKGARQQIEKFRNAGCSIREIAKLTGLSPSVVHRYCKEIEVYHEEWDAGMKKNKDALQELTVEMEKLKHDLEVLKNELLGTMKIIKEKSDALNNDLILEGKKQVRGINDCAQSSKIEINKIGHDRLTSLIDIQHQVEEKLNKIERESYTYKEIKEEGDNLLEELRTIYERWNRIADRIKPRKPTYRSYDSSTFKYP